MQITLKTLQQQTFRIDIDPEETLEEGGCCGQSPSGWTFLVVLEKNAQKVEGRIAHLVLWRRGARGR